MEKQFDKDFQTFLENGSRSELADYRNCIIQECYERIHQRKDLEPIQRAFGEVLDEQNARKIRCGLMAFVFFLLFLFNCAIAIIVAGAGQTYLVIFNLLVAVVNGVNISMWLKRHAVEKRIYGNLCKTNIHIYYEKPETPFPEISQDSDEALRLKKEVLDEILGF